MNDHSGGFPHHPVSPFGKGTNLPSTGLRDVALAPAQPASKVNLWDLWRVVLKWWWLIAGIVVACLLLAVVASLMIQPEYRARTILEINKEGITPVQMGELQQMQFQDRDYLNTQAGLLRSRGLAERVARTLNLANNPAFIGSQVPDSQREEAAASLLETSIFVEPIRDSRLLQLQVESTDPGLAAQIANSYADNFISLSLERRYQASSYARNFLEERLATVRSRLEQSERQLVAYAQQQGIVSLNVDSGSGEGGRSEQPIDAASLVVLNEALQMARNERIAAEQRHRQARANPQTTDVLNNPTVQTLATQRAELQAEYQEKLGIFQPDYPQMVQLRSRIEALDQAIARQSTAVSSSLGSEVAGARARESELQARVDGLKNSLLDLRARSIQYTILQREVDTNRALYDALLQRYKEVGIAGGVGMNAISVVDRAQVPGAPFKPNLPLNIAFGLIAGLILGFGSAFALEWMDDTIKTPDDLREKLGIAPIGVIPAVAKGTSVKEELEDNRSQISEAYKSVRTALQFATEHGIPKTVLITSTRAGEGKSTSALSIAYAMANLNATVLLIDSDLRKPTFRSPTDSDGFSSLLAGSDDLEGNIHPTDHERLFLLPAGKVPPNPAELLAGDRLAALLARLATMFDHIVVDGPPVLGLADSPLLATQCEGTLMVIEAGVNRRAAALNSVNRLRSVGAHMLGGILTKFSSTKSGYGYGYGYGYGDDAYAYREGDEPKRQIELRKSA